MEAAAAARLPEPVSDAWAVGGDRPAAGPCPSGPLGQLSRRRGWPSFPKPGPVGKSSLAGN